MPTIFSFLFSSFFPSVRTTDQFISKHQDHSLLEYRQALNPCLWHGSASLHLPAAQILGLPGAPTPGPLGVTSQ